MTNDEINTAVALDDGWKDLTIADVDSDYNYWKKGQLIGRKKSFSWDKVPDYANSLDAIMPVVRKLSPLEQATFMEMVIGEAIGDPNFKLLCLNRRGICKAIIAATARHYCLALIKMRGKWKE